MQLTTHRRGSRISARGGRQGNDDLIWDGNERFLTYANTDLQLFKMFTAIWCLNGVEQIFKRHQCPFFLPLRRGNPRLRRGSFRPRGGRPPQRPPPGSAPDTYLLITLSRHNPIESLQMSNAYRVKLKVVLLHLYLRPWRGPERGRAEPPCQLGEMLHHSNSVAWKTEPREKMSGSFTAHLSLALMVVAMVRIAILLQYLLPIRSQLIFLMGLYARGR